MKGTRTSSLVIWLVAGTVAGLLLDLYLAVVLGLMEHLSPLTLQQWFASNVVGMRAFSGGIGTAILGLVLHLGISLAWAAIFVFATSRVARLGHAIIPTGIGFGILVFLVMQFVVVPLDRSPKSPLSLNDIAVSAVGIVFAFALPLAAICARFCKSEASSKA